MDFGSIHLPENKQDESLIRTWSVLHTKCSSRRRKKKSQKTMFQNLSANALVCVEVV